MLDIINKTLSQISRLESKSFINGKFVDVQNSFEVINPSNSKVVGNAAYCSDAMVSRAVLSAKDAFKDWKNKSPIERGELLRKCADECEKNKEEIISILTLETGKAIRTESRVEVESFIENIRFYAGLGSEIKGETIPLEPEKMLTFTQREPFGVVAAILPWNLPLLLMSFKVCPALLTGNSVVVKPSENATFSVLRVIEIFNQFLPAGVLNLVSGDGYNVGGNLVSHSGISKVSYTGSMLAGKSVYNNAANNFSHVTLEMGGKSPMIICEDADMTRVIQGAVDGMRFTRQGQSCTASSRIYVHEKIFDEFVASLKEKLDGFKIGDPFDEETDIGAIISSKQYNHIISFLDKELDIIKCNKLPDEHWLKEGFFLQPMLVINPPEDHKVMKEEIFGPICCILKWNNFDEVLAKANDTIYGLSSSIWTNDNAKIMKAIKEIDAGLVQVNQNVVVKSNLPFGGFKNSGIGQEATKESMIENYTKRKTIIINLK